MRHTTQALRSIATLGAVLLLFASASRAADEADTADPAQGNQESVLTEQSMGSEDAPVTMIEYSSLTCPHCADFHTDTLPKLKEQYIDTGKLRLVFRDFPLDPVATGAAMLAHCVGPDRYFGFLDALFRSQSTWAGSPQPIQELERLSRFAGLSPEQFRTCLQDRDLLQALQQRAEQAKAEHGITSTPTFIIEGEKLEGSLPLERFQSVIDAKLGEEDEPKATQAPNPAAPGTTVRAEIGASSALTGPRRSAAP